MYAVEDVIDFYGVVLIQHAFEAGIFSEPNLAFGVAALLGGLLYLIAFEALQVCYFVELHALYLTPLGLGALVLLVVAQLAGVKYFTAGCLHQTVSLVVLASHHLF